MQKPSLFRKQPTQSLEIVNYVSMQVDNPSHGCIVPEEFLQNHTEINSYSNKTSLSYCPIPSRKIPHSPQIEQMLTKSVHGTINCSNEIFWCFQEYKLMIWFGSNGENQLFPPVESIFDQKISSVTIVELNPYYEYWEKLFKQNITLVCVAFGPLIHFYSLVQKKYLEPLHIIINTTLTCICQMIILPKAIRQQQVPLFYIDINGRVGYFNILKMKKHTNSAWYNFVYDSVFKIKSDTKILKVLASQEKIYVLLNKYIRQNKFTSYLYRLIGKSQASIPILKTAMIEQYQWSQSIGIKHKATINSEKLSKKLWNSFQEFLSQPDLKNLDMNLNIASINLEDNHLKIILQCGFSIQVDNLSNVSFYDRLKGMPQLSSFSLLQDVGQRKILTNVNVLLSTDNAIVTDDKIFIQDRQWLHIGGTNERQPLKLIKLKKDSFDNIYSQPTRWILIAKSYYRVYWQLQPSDIILSLLSIYFQAKTSNEITDIATQRLQQKITKLIKSIGDVSVMAAFISLLSQVKTYKLIISSDVYNHFSKVLLDKNLTSGSFSGEKQLEITKPIQQYLWMKIQLIKNWKISQKIDTKNPHLLYNGLLMMSKLIIKPFKNKNILYFRKNRQNIITLLQKLENLTYFLKNYQNKNKLMLSMDKSKRDAEMQAIFGKKWSVLADQTMDQQLPSTLRKQNHHIVGINSNNNFNAFQNRMTPSLLFSYSSQQKNQQINKSKSEFYENYLDPNAELVKQLAKYLPKLKVLMELCLLLSQTYAQLRFQQVPIFQQIFKNHETKKKFAQKAVQVFKDRDEPVLDTLEEYFPELEISTFRCYQIWKKNQMFYLEPHNKLNPDSIAKLLDFSNIRDIAQFYKEKRLYRDYLEILIEKIRQILQEEKVKGMVSQTFRSEMSSKSIKLFSKQYTNELREYLLFLTQNVTDKKELQGYLCYAYEKGVPVSGIVQEIIGIDGGMKEKVRAHGSRAITQQLQKQMVNQMFSAFWSRKNHYK